MNGDICVANDYENDLVNKCVVVTVASMTATMTVVTGPGSSNRHSGGKFCRECVAYIDDDSRKECAGCCRAVKSIKVVGSAVV